MIQSNTKSGGPSRLPIVKSRGQFYFVDERLKQFREVTNPHNFIDFDSEEGRRMIDDHSMSVAGRIINMLKKEG